jgi:hypothetical protein
MTIAFSGQDSRPFVVAMAEDTPGVEAVTIRAGQSVAVHAEGGHLRLMTAEGTTVFRLLGPDVALTAEQVADWPAPWERSQDHSDDVLVKAVRRACSVTLSNWASREAIVDELAKEEFVGDIDARLQRAWDQGLLAVGYPGGEMKWRADG